MNPSEVLRGTGIVPLSPEQLWKIFLHVESSLAGVCAHRHTDAPALENSLEEGQRRKKSFLGWLGCPHGPFPVCPLLPSGAEPKCPSSSSSPADQSEAELSEEGGAGWVSLGLCPGPLEGLGREGPGKSGRVALQFLLMGINFCLPLFKTWGFLIHW